LSLRGLPLLLGTLVVFSSPAEPLFNGTAETPAALAGTAAGRPLRKAPYGPIPENRVYRAPPRPPSFPGLDQTLTRYYIRRYSEPAGLAWLQNVMNRGGPYLAFIRGEIEARGLPPELLYLPVIESGYLSTAVSKYGATGLWQFMKNSIDPFDMRVTEWMDERMDFWKSTQGALQKLKDNYNTLGDWPLALAAYNAGLGAVNRVIKQTGLRNYWTLAEKKLLKTETIHYVPKLLAVSHILSDPRRFGLDLDWTADPEWTRLGVKKTADLDILAREAGVDGEILKWANRELRYGITPPGAEYRLKVRAADMPALSAVLARADTPLIRYHLHHIQYGDTLSALARRYGLTTAHIREANPGVRERYLKIGEVLRIPALAETGSHREEKNAGESLAFEGAHLVKRGETLWSIALSYGVDPQVLAEANGMALEDTLREGRSLKTPILK
jgi:membrane-bound lytic murein transglycosylase D